MDFEAAAVRLARDQSKLKGRTGKPALSDKAKKQAEFQKKQQARLRAEREHKKKVDEYQRQYVHMCERLLKEKPIGPAGNSLLLTPTSIYGDGDKIALPPSVLETLTSAMDEMLGGGNPWTFRIGILNPDYKFPASPLVQNLNPPTDGEYYPMDEDKDDNDNSDNHDDGEDDDDNDENDQGKKAAFVDELRHKYLAHTHCTVVEFTQEEGYVGIPQHIASALLDPKNRHAIFERTVIPTTRTVDSAGSIHPIGMATSIHDDDNEKAEEIMETTTTPVDHGGEHGGDQTPGHLAWGAFDLPEYQLEITMVKLPKGRGCTLTPTPEAVKNNFYGLKDVKLVLEQSLIRTRATLSTGDVVSTWHRGIKFDLNVSKVIPSTFNAVTCINTDIEVDIGETKAEPGTQSTLVASEKYEENGFRLGTGKDLSPASQTISSGSTPKPSFNVSLLPEPPIDQKDGVCTVLIRHSQGQAKRRFAVDSAKMKDLFAFAASLTNRSEHSFRLVTRFPRREIILARTGETTLAQAGLQQGQELLLVEDL
jgi:hypothetical protein